MSATIQVIGGSKNGTQFWIEEPVIRIGSDPAANLVIAETAPHALTLQYRDGRYWVLNRTSNPIMANGKTKLGTSPMSWDASETIQISKQVQLQLKIAGNPAPTLAPRKQPAGFDDGTTAKATETTNEPTKSLIPSIAILVGCGMLIVLMLADTATSSSGAASSSSSYESIVSKLNSTDEEIILRKILQDAMHHEKSGDYEQAVYTLIEARERLAAHPTNTSALAYVKRKILKLGPKVPQSRFF